TRPDVLLLAVLRHFFVENFGPTNIRAEAKSVLARLTTRVFLGTLHHGRLIQFEQHISIHHRQYSYLRSTTSQCFGYTQRATKTHRNFLGTKVQKRYTLRKLANEYWVPLPFLNDLPPAA